MIVHEVAQNSLDWWRLRLGVATASCFDKIVTPKTCKRSTQAAGYMHQLLGEWATGIPHQTYTSRCMERGHELEEEAWAWYELRYDASVIRGGFCTTDDGHAGCSPDGRIYEGDRLVGGIELKCPAPSTHVGYLLNPFAMLDAYRHQVAGTLLITGAEWWDLMSYHPLIAPVVMRVDREDVNQYMVALEDELKIFSTDMQVSKERLRNMGVEPRQYTEPRSE